MSKKGRLLLIANHPSQLSGPMSQLSQSGFRVTTTSIAREILRPQNRGLFQNILLSIDLVDDSFLEQIQKVERFLGAPCTLFSESTNGAARLLKIDHPWKIYGVIDAHSIERTYVHARVKFDSSKSNRPWTEVKNSASKILDIFLGPHAATESLESWRELDWIDVQPIQYGHEHGYLIVGTQSPTQRDSSKRILDQWSKSLTNSNSAQMYPPFSTASQSIHNQNYEVNPFFLIKSVANIKTGTGFLKDSKPLPSPLRTEGGYCVFDIKCLSPNIPLNFDVYIYLRHNRRILKLANAGSIINTEKYQQIVEVGHGEFHIHEEQKGKFFQQASILNLRAVTHGKTLAA